MEVTFAYPRLIRRIRAILIDSMIAFFVIITWWLSLPLLVEQPVYLKLAYPVIAWFILDPLFVYRFAGTPGHYLMKLRIQNVAYGKNTGLMRAVVRSIIKLITGSWSFILVLMTRRHQAIHDKLTGTEVVLRNPELIEQHEQLGERLPDTDHYRYPSAARRLLMMFMYTVLSIIPLVILTEFFLSDECLNYNRCSGAEHPLGILFSWGWFFSVAAILVFGWRAQLYGARKKPLPES